MVEWVSRTFGAPMLESEIIDYAKSKVSGERLRSFYQADDPVAYADDRLEELTDSRWIAWRVLRLWAANNPNL
jgi:hypothetical protein